MYQQILALSLQAFKQKQVPEFTSSELNYGYQMMNHQMNTMFSSLSCIESSVMEKNGVDLGLYELCLLIAVKRRTEKSDESFSFNTIYHDYLEYITEKVLYKVVGFIEIGINW